MLENGATWVMLAERLSDWSARVNIGEKVILVDTEVNLLTECLVMQVVVPKPSAAVISLRDSTLISF